MHLEQIAALEEARLREHEHVEELLDDLRRALQLPLILAPDLPEEPVHARYYEGQRVDQVLGDERVKLFEEEHFLLRLVELSLLRDVPQ